MSQKPITIYTPAAVAPHIYAEDEAQHNRAMLGGGGSGIEDVDLLLACAKVDDNTVRLSAGRYAVQGYELCVPGGDTEDLAVDSGTSGTYRKDLVIAEFVRGGGETADTLQFRVLKGTAAASEGAAVDPTLIQDDLSTGGSTRQESVYRISISGTTLGTITRIAPYVGNFYA